MEVTPLRENPQARALGDAYAQNKGKPTAYLDETYRARSDRPDEVPFYLFTAVVVAAEERPLLTSDLRHIAGGNYWHTTESLKKEEDHPKILEMCQCLGEGVEPCVIACKVEDRAGNGDAEEMRRACMLSLLGALWNGGEAWPAVELMVMERRAKREQVGADQHTMKVARSQGLVGRAARLEQVSPSLEPLLWLPDLVSSATRQKLVMGNSTFYDEFADQVHYVPVP